MGVQERDQRRQRFEEVFDENLRAVYAYVVRRAAASDADDAVAEVFLVAWRRLEHVPRDAKPWLLAVARRVLANQRRAAGRRATLLGHFRREPLPVSVEAKDAAPIVQALARVSRMDREVLMLIAWDGLSVEEAAAARGCSRAAAKVRVHRARRRLRAVLAQLEQDERMRPRLLGELP